jgi:pimeloyl-ACP methyl ester carboxylesterase
MVGLVQALGETEAVIVGHDWGAPVAWHARCCGRTCSAPWSA